LRLQAAPDCFRVLRIRPIFFETRRELLRYKQYGATGEKMVQVRLRRHVSEPSQQPLEELIRQCLARAEYRQAFERVLELYSRKIFHLALSMLRNEAQAEDMAQDILIKIWKGLPSYHGGASLSTWIYTIARNTCLTELKKRAARPTVSLSEPAFEETLDAVPALQCTDADSGTALDVNHLLSQLPEKYRQVIALFYLEQKSYEEVGTLLGLPLGTVKTFLYRAKKQLLKLSSRRTLAAT
jgi:RNA polymerase sigma-70 factor (ECF subfamily)